MVKLGEEEDKEEEPATEPKREYTDVGLDLGKREKQVACHASAIAVSESLMSFTNRFFHFSEPPGIRMVFDTAERNGRFGFIQCQRSKESSRRGTRKRRIFLYRKTVKVKVIGKVIPMSFLKIEGRGMLVWAKDRGERGTVRRIGR